jgi:hypothetical protein
MKCVYVGGKSSTRVVVVVAAAVVATERGVYGTIIITHNGYCP